MSYLLLDDCYAGHPKMSGLPVQAKWLHTTALCFCAEKLTDGEISRHALAIIGATAEVSPAKYVPLLVERGMWKPNGDGWTIHDYLEHNPSAEQVKEKRAAAAERQRKWRDVHREVTGRFTRDVTRYATGDVIPPHPHPLPSPNSVSSTPNESSYEGTDAHAFGEPLYERIVRVCSSRDSSARLKLDRTRKKYGASEHDLERILFAICQPDTIDPTGKALSMLKRRSAA